MKWAEWAITCLAPASIFFLVKRVSYLVSFFFHESKNGLYIDLFLQPFT